MIFDIDNPEYQEIKKAVNAMVNDGIDAAIRAGMQTADTTLKVKVVLDSVTTADGKALLVPIYKHKTGIKVGGSYDGDKGEAKSPVGMYRDKDGYWHEKMIDQQMRL